MLLGDSLDQIAVLDQKYAALLEGRIKLLQQLAEIDDALKRVEIDRAEFAPVYSIPEDVLKIILEESCAHPPPPTPYSCLTHFHPLQATHVCRRWRRTAMALSTIWTCICLEEPIKLLRLRLERSGIQPLRIWGASVADEEHTVAVLQHASRWKSVEAGSLIADDRTVDYLDANWTIGLPALEYVTVKHNRRSYILFTSRIPCPNLKYLKLEAIDVRWTGRWQSFTRLQALNLTNVCINNKLLHDLCGAAPQLVKLALQAKEIEYPVEGRESRIITFPRLETLRFISTDWEVMLCTIDAPALRSIECIRGEIRTNPIWTISTKYPSLSLLRLLYCFTEAQDGGPLGGHLFRQASHLKSLELIDCDCSSKVLSCLADQTANDGHPFVPDLEMLTVTGTLTPEHLTLLHTVARNRTLTPSPLRELRLGFKNLERVNTVFGDPLSQQVKLVEYKKLELVEIS